MNHRLAMARSSAGHVVEPRKGSMLAAWAAGLAHKLATCFRPEVQDMDDMSHPSQVATDVEERNQASSSRLSQGSSRVYPEPAKVKLSPSMSSDRPRVSIGAIKASWPGHEDSIPHTPTAGSQDSATEQREPSPEHSEVVSVVSVASDSWMNHIESWDEMERRTARLECRPSLAPPSPKSYPYPEIGTTAQSTEAALCANWQCGTALGSRLASMLGCSGHVVVAGVLTLSRTALDVADYLNTNLKLLVERACLEARMEVACCPGTPVAQAMLRRFYRLLHSELQAHTRAGPRSVLEAQFTILLPALDQGGMATAVTLDQQGFGFVDGLEAAEVLSSCIPDVPFMLLATQNVWEVVQDESMRDQIGEWMSYGPRAAAQRVMRLAREECGDQPGAVTLIQLK